MRNLESLPQNKDVQPQGIIKIEISLPADEAQKLEEFIESGDPRLADLHIINMKVISDGTEANQD